MRKSIILAAINLFAALVTVGQQDFTGSDHGTFTDSRDRQVYQWVRIGQQVWMAENLNYVTIIKSYCYKDEAANCGLYGRFYDWTTATNACPVGWHLPVQKEWAELMESLGGKPVAGGYLKESGITHWHKPNKGATNERGFTALPGGCRSPSGDYSSLGYYAYFWSMTGRNESEAWRYSLYTGSDGLDFTFYSKDYGFSVRCVKDL
jgi:uncharacterized protein (TIGR02145 family)